MNEKPDHAPTDTSPARGPARLAHWGTEQVGARSRAATRWIAERRDDNVVLDVACRLQERDRAAAGSVIGSALAFRLFLFFVPFLLFAVGLMGFVAEFLDTRTVSSSAGVTGTLAEQINTAFAQPNSTRWFATLTGFVGIVTAGRVLAKVLNVASALAWQVPARRRAEVRVVAMVVGTTISVALLAALTNRLRESAGVGLAWLSFLPVVVVYVVAWGLLCFALPRGTSDPSAVLPGAILFGLTLAGMEAVTQLYLPDRFSRASALYGSVGVTVVILGWFFILGRVMALAMTLNAVVYERIGSIAKFVFGLPLLRALPRRSPRLARMFGVDQRDRNDIQSASR